jgi:hypothetical protein
MGANNILNSLGASDPLNPDYAFPITDSETVFTFKPQNGPTFIRRVGDGGRLFAFEWKNRSQATRDALRQWERQYKYDFFSFNFLEEGRYYSGRLGPLEERVAAYDLWDLAAVFEELPGVPLFAYPANWARDAIFIEERDSLGNDLVKLTGAWTYEVNGNAHGGANYYSANNDDRGVAIFRLRLSLLGTQSEQPGNSRDLARRSRFNHGGFV